MRIIAGLAKQFSGSYHLLCGRDRKRDVNTLGALIEKPVLYENMTAIENMEYFKLIFGIEEKRSTEDLLNVVGLRNYDKKKVKDFSLGMNQGLGIAISLLGNPKLAILDEPINGLDAQGVLDIRKLIQNLNEKEGMTVIISSHILSELSKLATHYAIIDNGRVVDEFDKETLIKECGLGCEGEDLESYFINKISGGF